MRTAPLPKGPAPATDQAAALAAALKAEAGRLGFSGCGIVALGDPADFAAAGAAWSHPFYQRWLAAGHAGEMGYLRRHAAPKRHPGALLPGARSLIALTHAYGAPALPRPAGGLRGRVSRYAWGRDYHDVLANKLERLAAFLQARLGRPLRHVVAVDSKPLLEREYAARAGLGFVGKNACLIDWERGSWLFLAELLVDVALAPDAPRVAAPLTRPSARRDGSPETAPLDAMTGDPLPWTLRESCGSCTACLDACPTGAIVAPKTVDARRCISYLTIELKGPIPEPLRPALGAWVFGCDVCQDVCPWNHRVPRTSAARTAAAETCEPAFQATPERAHPSLADLLGLDEAAFRARFAGTPLLRPKRRGLLRNAALALGNVTPPVGAPDPGGLRLPALAALRHALADPEPLVRGAAAWALGRIGGAVARETLAGRLPNESDPTVVGEVRRALAGLGESAR
jgi:epoxyqueuosine reductase